ncbi:MAG: ATP-dependent DNA ligase [Firmicutes bacterium]|nr:ATP-dependent DNA ligase [Bacillota bacterium]
MKLPLTLAPMLAVPAPPFDSPDYFFEIKWDGERCLAFLTSTTRLQSRNQRDITFQYPELTTLHRQLRQTCVVLDGEIIALENGKPSFFRLQSRMHATSEQRIKEGRLTNPVVYVVFDLLYAEGKPLLHLPLYRRRELLDSLLIPTEHLITSTYLPEQGRALYSQIASLGLEGIVGKEKNSPYLPGKRSPAWKKSRVTKSANFVLCGYTTNPHGRKDLSALVLGAYEAEALLYYGLVGTGLSQAEIAHLLALFTPLTRAYSPLANPPRLASVTWLEPTLVCEVEYLQVTADRRLRHPLYKGLRPVAPQECRAEDIC